MKKKHNEDELKNNNCSCNDECHCDDECHCSEECTCGDECHCNEDEINNYKLLVSDLNEKLLRNQAELMNYKRRKDEEVYRMKKYEGVEFMGEFLPILDNLERAIQMDDDNLNDEVSKFLSGIKMIYSSLKMLLEKYEIVEIDALGHEFDPNYHEAVLTDKNEEKKSGEVLEVLQKGYLYKDRVIRPSMVKVNE